MEVNNQIIINCWIMRSRHKRANVSRKSSFSVNKKLQFDCAAEFVCSCLWMLLGNNTKSHCSTCGMSLALSHWLLSWLARPRCVCKQGTGIHGLIVLHHYCWQAQMTWMMGNPHTKLTRPRVFTLPKSCCSLAWNRRRGKIGLTSWHLQSTCPELCMLAGPEHVQTAISPHFTPQPWKTPWLPCVLSVDNLGCVFSCLQQVCVLYVFQMMSRSVDVFTQMWWFQILTLNLVHFNIWKLIEINILANIEWWTWYLAFSNVTFYFYLHLLLMCEKSWLTAVLMDALHWKDWVLATSYIEKTVCFSTVSKKNWGILYCLLTFSWWKLNSFTLVLLLFIITS